MKFTISVRDMEKGRPHGPAGCPMGRAIAREIGEKVAHVLVGVDVVEVWGGVMLGWVRRWKMSTKARAWCARYDDGLEQGGDIFVLKEANE
jgi:hypothetical protein